MGATGVGGGVAETEGEAEEIEETENLVARVEQSETRDAAQLKHP